MAWTASEDIQPQRWTQFKYFKSTSGTAFSESVAPGIPFKLTAVRVHCSVAFASVQDLTVQLSAIKGSAHNVKFLSQALAGITDLVWQPDPEHCFLSDDQVVIATSNFSGANVVGIEVEGWAARG